MNRRKPENRDKPRHHRRSCEECGARRYCYEDEDGLMVCRECREKPYEHRNMRVPS